MSTITYFLVQGEQRLACGITEPRFDAARKGWITDTGLVADFDGTAYTLVAEEAEPQEPAPDADAAAALARQFEVMLDDHIDRAAKGMGYLNTLSAISYADEPAVPRFQLEGQALRAWRSRVYARAIEVQEEVATGQRPLPSPQELISLMPAFERPVV